MIYLAWILQILLVPLVAPLGIGIINAVKAKMQRRKGPSIFQPYRNFVKLLHKDEVISKDASWIAKAAPFIVFAVTFVVGACIPLFSTSVHLPASDLFAVIYTLAIGTFFLALAGMDAGSAFGGFGSSREMTVSAMAEGALIFSIVPLALLCGTTDLADIAAGVSGGYHQFIAPILLAFVGFTIALLAENTRYPFDNPDTHLELTMIHEAMILEYSGKRLALVEWAAANKLFIFAALGVNLFFPVGIATTLSFGAIALSLLVLFAKVLAVYICIALLESLIAKFRFFRLSHLIFTAIIFNVIAIGMVITL